MIKSVLDSTAQRFLKRYIDTASPTGFEEKGAALWFDYIRPYVDTTYTDTYGTAVAVINPSAPYKVVIEATETRFLGL